MTPKSGGGKEAGKAEAIGKGKRDYILGPNDTPLHVGEGLGDLDYDDAVRLSTVRAAALARGGTQAAQGAPSQQWGPDEILKIVKAVQEFAPSGAAAPKSYVVTRGAE
ncbi:unnamed protein product, partial [marine sediment metagenome]